jgi:hypothetical protein
VNKTSWLIRHPFAALAVVVMLGAAGWILNVRSQVATAYAAVENALLRKTGEVAIAKLSENEQAVWVSLRALPLDQKSIRRVDNISASVLWIEVTSRDDGRYLLEVVDIDASVPSVVAIQKQ